MTNITAFLILFFFGITYVHSGYEKVSDWKNNIKWLKGHFAETFLKNFIPIALSILLIMEMVTSALCIVGMIELCNGITSHYALYAAVASAIILLVMLLGQRLAKDYDGARNIAIYFIPAIMGVYLLQ